MHDLHAKLQPYLDGELPSAEIERFHQHLVSCEACQSELRELLLLDLAAARAIDLQGRRSRWPALRPTFRRALPALRRLQAPAAFFGLAAAVVALLMGLELRELRMAQRSTRPQEWRLSSQPYQQLALSRGSKETFSDPPFLALAWLSWRGDTVAIADAYLLRGQAEAAEHWLDRGEQSADALTTWAALDLQLGKPAEAADHADQALRLQAGHPAALWNRALALKALQLPLAAARAFDAVAALEEPGWADEARATAAKLRDDSRRRRAAYDELQQRCQAAMRGEAPYPLDLVDRSRRLARVCFYDVLRSAGTAEALSGLQPVADALDQHFGTGAVLSRAVSAAKAAASGPRAQLSAEYARALAADGGADAWAKLASEARAAGQADLELGAMYFLPAGRLDLSRYRALAIATSDPWFATLAEEKTAEVERQQGHPLRALDRLRPIDERCRTADRVEDRCLTVGRAVAFSYAMLHQTLEAKKAGWRALEHSRTEMDLRVELHILEELGQVTRIRHEMGLARAYMAEVLERAPDSCGAAEFARSELAMTHLRLLDFAEARRQVDLLQRCDQPPSLRRMFVLADLQRTRAHPGDEALIRRGVEAFRASAAGAGEQALATHVLGRAVLERDRGEGERLLRDAIAQANRLSGSDRLPEKVRLYSYTSLILEAGRRGEDDRALALLAEERGWAAPPRCSVWLTADDERLLVLAVGADGRVRSRYEGARSRRADAEPGSLVPPELIQAVRSCAAVQVIARPPLEGLPGLLPPEIPWSQVLRHGAQLPPGSGPRVVVSSPSLPASLGLPDLSAPARAPGTVWLEGPDATPSRVLRAARDASLLELHVHGLVDPEVADASYLVLSPEPPSGHFALTARDVRKVSLGGHPLVLLAACDSGDVATDLEEGAGLPEAFVEAGARAVLAVSGRIKDPESELFFRPLLARIQAGAPPAAALREARVAWHQAHGPGWADSVLLYE